MDREFLGWACLAGAGGGLLAMLGMAALDVAERLADRHAGHHKRRGGVPAVPVPCPTCQPDPEVTSGHRSWCPRLGTTGQDGTHGWQPEPWAPLPLHAPPRTLGGQP